MNIKDRISRLRQRFAEYEIDGILISQPENRRYLSGFDGSAGYLVITAEDQILATDFRYLEQAKRQAPSYRLFVITGAVKDWLPGLISAAKVKRLGFEAEHITFSLHHRFSDIISASGFSLRLIPTTELVAYLRAIKEPEEIELITRAAALSDGAFEYVAEIIQPGMREQDVGWELEKFLRSNGSEAVPFEIMVASGPNAALPHARASTRPINRGEPIILDLGARVNGYSSDLSRTIFPGEPEATFAEIYRVVLEAQMTAITAIKEGMTGEEADRTARRVIEKAGYGEAFGHSLGHGIGLASHESPRLGPNATEVLVNGMVFTIEPGIYLSGRGGVRIEDIAVMENGKLRIISQSKKAGV
jgi:Xaa-Pro aminopeptidase